MDNHMKLYYESLDTQRKIWNSLLGTHDNGRNLMSSKFVAKNGPDESWEIWRDGALVGYVSKGWHPKRMDAIEYWKDIHYGRDKPNRVAPSHTQVGGTHYKSMEIQPSEFNFRNKLDWLEGNAIKYICRHHAKGGMQDIDKAIHYLELLKEWRYGTTQDTTIGS